MKLNSILSIIRFQDQFPPGRSALAEVRSEDRVLVIVGGVDGVCRGFIADRCGTVFVPANRIKETIALGERIARRQDGMVGALQTGRSVAEVMHDKEFEANKEGAAQ